MKEMRRKDRAITKEEALTVLQTGEYGVLSSVSDSGEPYGVPISYCFVDEAIYFHSAHDGRKLDNIDTNKKVSFCVVGKTEVLPNKFTTNFESVIVEGKIEKVSGKDKQLGLVGLVKKYSNDFMNKGMKYIKNATDETTVLKLTINDLSGKARK